MKLQPRRSVSLPHWLGAMALILVVSLLVQAPPALAQGTEVIRVIDEQRWLDFPSSLEFTVAIEGDNPLSQARLNYRVAGSRVWSYSNADLPMETSATVRFVDLLRDSVYLPPGTTVEYFYTFWDVAGNSLETPVVAFEYADSRFQWDEITIGPLTLFHHDLPRSRVEDVAAELTLHLEGLVDLLQLDDPEPIRGFVYNSYDEAAPAFPNHSRTMAERQVFHGFAFQDPNVFVGIGLHPYLIVHESAHLMLAQSLESAGRPIPSWLDEGLASYVEPGSRPYSGESLSGRGLPLSSMSALSGTPEDIDYFYLKSESVVAFLIETYGVDSFRQFLSSFRRGDDVDTALISAYGFDLAGLESEWSTSGSGRSSSPSGRFDPTTPFLLFNSWFLGGLVLIVMAAVLVRYIIRKLRPPAEEDGAFYWDD